MLVPNPPRKPMTAFRNTPMLFLAASAALTLSACSVAPKAHDAASRPFETLVVQQGAPLIIDVDIGVAGKSVGDLYIFGAAVTDSKGRKGSLTGTLLVADAIDPKTGKVWETRLGDLTFILDGDQLLAKGASVYPRTDREMEVNKPQVRALIGGTGRFVGVDGDVSTVRNADGTYTHTFRLMR